MPLDFAISKDFRKLLAFGSGVGLEIGATDLEIAVTRVRPNKIQVLGRLTIENYAARPAAEWGAEYARFLKASGAERLSATVLLPRREAIVRQIALPGVAAKDIAGAIRFQLDTLHPYGEDDVVWGWSPLGYGGVLVGIVLRSTIERYVALFVEAGIAVRSFKSNRWSKFRSGCEVSRGSAARCRSIWASWKATERGLVSSASKRSAMACGSRCVR